MRNLFRKFLFISALMLIYSTVAAQGKYGVIGKIYPNQQSDDLFGKVTRSVQINAEELKNALEKTNDYVLFTIKDTNAVATNEKRESIIKNGIVPTDVEPMHFISKILISEILQNTKSNSVSLEFRETVFTISTLESTIEFSGMCPPLCP